MTYRLLLLVFLSAPTFGQTPPSRACTPESPCLRVRVSEAVTYSMADRKVLPDIADLKGRDLNEEVAVAVVVSKTGNVTGARAFSGDSTLFKRSQAAALKWHFKPYLLNREPIEFDTTLKFKFTKDKVEIVVPPPR